MEILTTEERTLEKRTAGIFGALALGLLQTAIVLRDNFAVFLFIVIAVLAALFGFYLAVIHRWKRKWLLAEASKIKLDHVVWFLGFAGLALGLIATGWKGSKIGSYVIFAAGYVLLIRGIITEAQKLSNTKRKALIIQEKGVKYMGIDERIRLISEIEKLRGSRIITLVTGERAIAPTQIADDCLKPLYEQLVSIRSDGNVKKIDLILETRGGSVETPWKLVTKIRQFCDNFAVIIPWKAYSAGTMICLGADEIVMSPMSELGPIDPWLQPQAQPAGRFLLNELGVEDVSAYITFLQQRACITDQEALATTVKVLAEHLTPTLLGRMERISSHIRLVARKLLSLSKPPIAESSMGTIVETLVQKMYAHGHGIGIVEAKTIGLNAVSMPPELEQLCWKLYLEYEEALNLKSNPDPRSYFPNDVDNVHIERDAVGLLLETTQSSYALMGDVRLERVRKLPPQVNLNFNFPFTLPPGTQINQQTPQELQAMIQQIIQAVIQQAGQQLPLMIQAEMAKQAPVEGVQHGWYGANWRKIR